MNKIVGSLIFASLAYAQSEGSTQEEATCVTKDNDLQGFPEKGQAFSDYDYLVSHESSEYVYKLTGVQLCTDDEGHLRGMETFVGKYSTEHEGRLISTLAMNKVGDVSGACKSLQVDPTKGEYIQRIIFRAGVDYVDAIWIGSNTRQTIFNGNHPAQFTDKVEDFSSENPFVGFWGTATLGEWIYSVGTVTVQNNCTVAYDPSVTPIEDINGDSGSTIPTDQNSGQSFMSKWSDHTGLDSETTIFVAAATTTVLVLAVAFFFGIAAHMRKKINTVQTVITISDRKDTVASEATTQRQEVDKRMSVKKVNGKVEIHQQIDQNGTEVEFTDDNDMESARNLSKGTIEQSENVISGIDLSKDMPTPQRNKTFKVVTR